MYCHSIFILLISNRFFISKRFRSIEALGFRQSTSGPIDSCGFHFDMAIVLIRWSSEFLRDLSNIVYHKHCHCVIVHHSSRTIATSTGKYPRQQQQQQRSIKEESCTGSQKDKIQKRLERLVLCQNKNNLPNKKAKQSKRKLTTRDQMKKNQMNKSQNQ